MDNDHLISLLTAECAFDITIAPQKSHPITIIIDAQNLTQLAQTLFTHSQLYFDFLNSITAIDLGKEMGHYEVIYHFTSIPFGHRLAVLVRLPHDNPKLASITTWWKTANWHEREAYDLMGIIFTDHPDLRRILLPEDWVGHPLRKDYETDDQYHGLTIKHKDAL